MFPTGTDDDRGGMNLIALDKDGAHIGMTSRAGSSYIVQRSDMQTYQEFERQVIEIAGR